MEVSKLNMEVKKLKPSSLMPTSEASTVMTQPPAPSTFFERQRWSSPHRNRTGLAVWGGRLLFILCLVGAAAALGVASHHLLSSGETQLAASQFESIANRALTEASESLRRKRSAVLTLSSIVSEMHPNAVEWPYVYVNGFERIAKSLLDATSGNDMGFVVFVRPEELSEWEDFAYDYFYNVRGYPSGTAVNSFGRGVFGVDPNLNNTDKRYHDTAGNPRHYDSPNTLLAPLFHVDESADQVLLFNMHSEPNRGRVIDDMINCTMHAKDLSAFQEHRCGSLTNMIKLVKFPENRGPGAVMYQPIYPANDPSTLVGLIPAALVWDEIFQNLFTEKINGVEGVISDGVQSFTYVVQDGVARYKAQGTERQSQHQINQRCKALTRDEVYADNSPMYQLCLYPTSDFFLGYTTKNPRIATIGSVVIIAFSALLFLLYDFLVRREFTAKKDLLEAKRRFMRFVSHEVRTPLNSVCMGLTVVQTEIANSLGYDNAEDLELKAGGGLALARRLSESYSPVSTEKENVGNDNKCLEWFGLAHEIRVNAMRAVDVLNDLLHYDKIENGELNLELTALPIWRIIEQTVNEFRLPATKKKINLDLEYDAFGTYDIEDPTEIVSRVEDLPHEVVNRKVIGDGVRLTQVLRNLLSNAIKFTAQKGYVRVKASWIKPDEEESYEKKKQAAEHFVLKDGETESFDRSGMLQVTVQDSGVGLSEDQLARLFRDGVQFNVNDLQAGQGSGLGLFITKGIVEQHNGHLVATSDGLGMGTAFTMTIPLYYVEEAKEEDLVSCAMSEASQVNTATACVPPVLPSTLRALVVDDVSSNRKLLCRLLKNRGHSFDEAPNGLHAIEMVTRANQEGAPYDTILMDYEMPVMNGPDAAKRIRSMGIDVFIVGITGNLLPEDVALFKSNGANAVLGKPLAMKALEDLWREQGLMA